MQSIPKVEEWMNGELCYLPNGVTIWAKSHPPAKKYAIHVTVVAGSAEDPLDRPGCAHCFEHIPFRGSGRFKTSLEINSPLEELAGEANASTSLARTKFYVVFDPAILAHGRDVISGMVCKPHFEGVETERQTILREYHCNQMHAGSRAHDEGSSALFIDEQWRRPILGTEESITTMTAQHLADFHQRWYTGDRIIVTIVGSGETKQLIDLAARCFQDLPPGTGRPHQPATAVVPAIQRQTHHLNWDIPGTVTGCANVFALDFANDDVAHSYVCMLNSGSSAPLYQRLREEKAYFYGYQLDTFVYRGFYLILFSAEISPARLHNFWEDFWEVTQSSEEVNARRLEWIKNQMAAAMRHANFNSLHVADVAASHLLQYGQVVSRNECLAGFQKVTLKQVREWQATYFNPNVCAQFVFTNN